MNLIEGIGIGRLLQTDIDSSCWIGPPLQHTHKAGHRLHGAGGANGEKGIAELQFAIDAFQFKRLLSEPADIGTDQGATGTAWQVLRRIGCMVGKSCPATVVRALTLKQFAVDVHHVL